MLVPQYFDAQLGEFKRLEFMMQTTRNPHNQHVPHDAAGRRIKRSSTFLLVQMAVSVAGLPLANAQTNSNCVGGAPCYDMYQGTIGAINQANYQPYSNGTTQQYAANWFVQNTSTAMTGGTLYSGPMSYITPAGAGTPTLTTLTSVTVFNCPSNTSNFTGSGTMEVTMSNSTEITSDTGVENSSSSFMEGSASLSIGYKPPSSTGGVNGSAEFTFDYGVEYDKSESTSWGKSVDSGTESVMALEFDYDVAPGYIQTIPVNSTITQYSNSTWTAPVYLSNTTASGQSTPINLLYSQMYKSIGATPTYSGSVAGTGVAGNVWYPATTWSSASGQLLASPSGVYAFWPNWTDDLVGVALQNSEQANITNYKGSGDNQGMVLRLDNGPCTGGCAGTFWATNGAGTAPTWDSNTSPAYIALLDNGNLVGYNSENAQIWTSNSSKGVLTAPQSSYQNAQPSTLLPPNGFSFNASGTYASTTYDTKAQLGGGNATLMTSSQVAAYCSGGRSDGRTAPQGSGAAKQSSNEESWNQGQFANVSPEEAAGFMLVKTSAQQESMQLAQQDVRERQDRRDVRRNELRQGVTQQRDMSGSQQDSSRIDSQNQNVGDRLDPKHANLKPVKLVKIKSPMVLKPSQYYAASLPGFKVKRITVRSDNLTNMNGFFPGPALTDGTNIGDGKEVKLDKIGKKTRFRIKPRPTV